MTIEEAEKNIKAIIDLIMTVPKQLPKEVPPMAAYHLGCAHAELMEALRLIKTSE